MLNDISVLLGQVINFGLNVVYLLYQILERILPGILFYSRNHAWWHNLISVVAWISLYLFLAKKYHQLFGYIKNRLSISVWERQGFALFPWWTGVCYCLAIALYFTATHFAWAARYKLMAILILAAAVIRLLVKSGSHFPIYLLYHLFLVLLLAVYGFIFMPIAVLVLALGAVAILFQAATPSRGDINSIERRPCPICGQTGSCAHR